MDKDVVHVYNRIPLVLFYDWNSAICGNMDATRVYHIKWSKSENERQKPYDTTYMWNLKYDTDEPIYERETDSNIENRLVIAKGEGVGGGLEWEVGLSRCKLLHMEWMNSKVLLYSTERTTCSILWLTIMKKNIF